MKNMPNKKDKFHQKKKPTSFKPITTNDKKEKK
jgi:hypothetical protein